MKRGIGAKLVGLLLVLAWMFAVSACSKKTVPVQSGVGPGAMPAGGEMGSGLGAGLDEGKWRELGLFTEPERREFMEKAQAFENEDIYFDFDSYVLSAGAKTILNKKAEFLKRYLKVRLTIEGHCDDRGTNEYNLALGESRAHSAFQYLVNSGIESERMNTISYGEERPLDSGQNEAAWAKNRRDHFVLVY